MGGYRIIDAGKLDRRITIEYAEKERTSTGAEKETWKVWAANIAAEQLRPFQNPKEGYKESGHVLMSEQFTTWLIRYRRISAPNVPSYPNSRMRLFDVAYPDKVYEVENVEEIGRREGWTLRTKIVNA